MRIKIQGIRFDVSAPYTEGHTLTAAEAGALNQVRAENVANNIRPEVKTILKGVFGADSVPKGEEVSEASQTELQDKITAYDKEYHFGMTGMRSTDPVTAMANKIARGAIEKKIKSEGMTVKQYKEENGKDAYRALVAQVAGMPQVQAEAKRQVEGVKKLSIKLAK